MDFADSKTEAKYRARISKWLGEQAAEYADINFKELEASRHLDMARTWQARKAKAEFAAISLSAELGGGGGTQMEAVIFAQEEAKHNLPSPVFFGIGIGMCLPTMMTYASDEQKSALIPKLLSGEHIWCQMFSEPSAGSDLGNVRTRAVKDGDDWIVNGQKVWTSQAHNSEYGILLTRTDPTVPKHQGLTFFFVNMKSKGVTVRPIRQMSGGAEFNEVFLENVRIPDDQRLGAPGDGWRVALNTLMFERQAAGEQSLNLIEFDDMMDLVCNVDLENGPAVDDSLVREQLCDWYLDFEGLRLALYRRLTALSVGQVPGAEAAMGKLVEAAGAQRASRICMDLMELCGGLGDTEVDLLLAPHLKTFLLAPGIRIAGGTDEILKNTIAERVLGLPQDFRVDKTAPFNELKG